MLQVTDLLGSWLIYQLTWNAVTKSSVNITVITIESHCKICNNYCRIIYLFLDYRSAGFLAYLSSDMVAGSIASIPFDTEVYDYDDNYDPVTGFYTVPLDGLYLLHARVYGSDYLATHSITVDGLDITYTFEHDPAYGSQSSLTSIVIHLVGGQVVAVNPSFTGTILGYIDIMSTSFGATLLHAG